VGSCTVAAGSVVGVLEGSGSGSVCEVCDCAVVAGASGAEGVRVGAAVAVAAAPGLLRAALGANFLPVVFSNHGLAQSAPLHGTTHC
jgi:hypothetical protein